MTVCLDMHLVQATDINNKLGTHTSKQPSGQLVHKSVLPEGRCFNLQAFSLLDWRVIFKNPIYFDV
jgi:hypothetical protein